MSVGNKHMVLLDKLIRGTITEHEKWQLEKASLDDPFLADAIEGYYDNGTDVKALDEIDLNRTKTSKRQIPIWKPLMVAASFLLLLSVAFWFMNDNFESDTLHSTQAESVRVTNAPIEKEIVVSEMEVVEEDQSALQWQGSDSETLDEVASNRNSEVFKSKSSAPISEEQRGNINENVNKETSYDSELSNSKEVDIPDVDPPRTQVINSGESILEDEEEIAVLKSVESKKKTSKDINAKMGDANNKSRLVSPSAPIHTVKGFVYSKSGAPIPNAEVFAAVSNEKTQTNDKGYFVMNVADMNQNINVVHANYNSESTLIAPEVSFNLSKIQSDFSEGSKSLVEMMSEKELINEYEKVLDRHFISEWNLCKEMEGTVSKRVRMQLMISEEGSLEDIDFIGNVPSSCQEEVKNHILDGVYDNIFKGKVAVTFSYTYYF